jgi:hypothetical protein
MTAIENAGRWLFVVVSGFMGLVVLKLLMSHFSDVGNPGRNLLRAALALFYLATAWGVARWRPWVYVLALMASAATIVVAVRRLPATPNRGPAAFLLALWVLCLLWLWLPGVREKFKPVTK